MVLRFSKDSVKPEKLGLPRLAIHSAGDTVNRRADYDKV